MRPGLIEGVRARLRPASFDRRDVGLAWLDELAVPVPGYGALCSGARPESYLEILPQGGKAFRPAFVLGAGLADISPRAQDIVPPARLYRLQGETVIFGKGLFLRGDALLMLDPLKFYELGRLDYPIHLFAARIEGERAELRLPRRARRIDGPILYVAQGGESVWGHWLVDILPRLAFGLTVPARTRVVLDADAPPWAQALLAYLGVPPSRLIWHDKFRERLVARDVYVPSFLRLGHAFSPLAASGWSRFPVASGVPMRKLYVSRARLPAGSSLLNHGEIETSAAARGYAVIHPERFSVRKQVRLFGEASAIVGEGGSALHNSVFSPAGTHVAVLESIEQPHLVQAGIGSLRAQPTGFAFGPGLAPGERRFRLDRAVFSDVLDRLDSTRRR